MQISDFLSKAAVFAEMAAANKESLLRDLAARTASSVPLSAEVVTSELLKRESLGSTGIGKGVAIPHARFRDLNSPVGLFAKLKRPIEFDAIDRQKVDLVFVLLLPEAQQNSQITSLALVARKLREGPTLADLRSKKVATEIYDVLIA
jgi:PTS system nitrogen regulatory IIA component